MSLDLAVLKEYARREREFMERAADLDVVTKERDAAKKLYDDLRNQRLKEFMEGFGIISMKLKEMYQASLHFYFIRQRADGLGTIDDHAGRKCGIGIGRFARSVLGGNHLQRHAAKEELEEHLESLGRREDAQFARARFRSACVQGQSSLSVLQMRYID